MNAYLASLDWGLRSIIYVGTGVFHFLLLYIIPKPILAWLSQKPGFSANAQTTWRVPVTWLGWYLMFSQRNIFLGFHLVVFGLSMDFVDGKTAKLMMAMENPKVKHNEGLGAVIDPLADKLTFLPPFFPFALQGVVYWPLVAIITLLELISQLMRRPFNLLISHQRKSKGKDRATGLGKFKVYIQFTTLLICGPLYFEWTTYSTLLPNIFTTAVVLMCGLSIWSKLELTGKAGQLNRQLTEEFDKK